MTGVYEHALGSEADDLHPKVRDRYAVDADGTTASVGRGTMDISRGTHVLPALYAMTPRNLLFPEAGKGVPFSVTTFGCRTDGDHEALVTRREFAFPRRRRRFDSLTVWDDENDRLLDFLGTGGLLVSELRPRVEAGALVVESGRQWLRRDDSYHRLPGPLAASVEVRDRFDEVDERYHVVATVENTLAGHILSYRGTFTQEDRERGDVDTTPPTERLTTLPAQ
ncbi:protein of unknown function [Halogranum rubrum]|uniref:DUF4166 domain-containing protein n=1 Tax=Halogranum rubrum TaxID=553466 RepID=A0A1I4BNZ5_9EURY|nr:DUF4166 domain-containing protein [Halogranum rubrum]SFK69696.1 protein of unknown function [Halogranum rubrum]